MSTLTDVKVPDIGNYSDLPVIEVLVKDGDTVEKDQPLIVLESDKATMEVPAPAAGTVHGLKVQVGDKLSEGNVICQLQGGGDVAASQTAAAPAPAPAPAPTPASGSSEPSAPPAPAPKRPESSNADVPSSQAAVGAVEVRIPDIGNYSGVPVIEVLVKDGDAVDKDQPLIVLESDKATMEVPAPTAGVVESLRVKVGDKLTEGDPVCRLRGGEAVSVAQAAAIAPDQTQSAPQPAPRPQPQRAPETPTPQSVAAATTATPGAVPYAGPATRKFARELGVDLGQVKGSGPRGRIVIEDVQGFVKTRMAQPAAAPAAAGAGIPPIPAVDFSQFGETETKPLARIRKLSAQFLHRSWVNVPHVTQTDEADVTDLEAFRKQMSDELVAAGGPKLTLLPFLMKACATAMKQYPEFNASLAPDGDNLILKKYCHIGFAADTPNGLVVPVVRDVWGKGIAELAGECAALAKKARDGKLKPDEMKGGCFSISSLGGIGGSHFTPIVNAPEVAILGVSKSQMKPVWDGTQFVPRLMCPLSLSYDHRVIDGAYAARFIVQLVKLVADIRRLSL